MGKRTINIEAIRQRLNESFIKGFCSSVSIFGVSSDFHLGTPEDDAEALASDWKSIGEYIIGEYINDASQKMK